jgi:hypothetical protein
MIKTEIIEIKLNAKTIKWYWGLGYSGTTNQVIKINVGDLIPTSHYKVQCICDICLSERLLPYKSYVKFINGDGKYYCHKCSMIKKRNTNLIKYGVTHTLQDSVIRENIKKTCQKKYNADCYLASKEYLANTTIKNRIRLKNCANGRWFKDEDLSEFLRYKRRCRTLTDKNRIELFNSWDGTDFYDGEYIKENFKLHFTNKDYPTVDHKISIAYGFRNKITEQDICSIENLCVTKRRINNSKREKCFYEILPNN